MNNIKQDSSTKTGKPNNGTNNAKHNNSIVASLLVSGLIVLSMVGIGVNALSSPGAAATTTASANVTLSSRIRTGNRSGEREGRNGTATTSNESFEISQ